MSTVVVTGASGFIGRHAVRALLEQGLTVHAVARHELAEVPAIWHATDLFDVAARRLLIDQVRPTHLLHLAWETRHGYFWEAPENLDWVAATLDLVRVFHDAGGKRVVLAGSCAEYDWTPEGIGDGICHEGQTACRPATLYGMAKNAAFELTGAFSERVGISHAGGRVFMVYGPFETKSRLVPSIICGLLQGGPVRLGDPSKIRDFMDARDAGAALAALLLSPVEGPINIAGGNKVSIGDVADSLARLIGRKDLFEFGALENRPHDPPSLYADVTRLTEEVGFKPQFDLEHGLMNSVNWWRQNLDEALDPRIDGGRSNARTEA
ncbi:MAG: NAD(P)-dependent oxidoreductase [Kiloniellales bacterium]|nr:NAD(P)-dependent oxidoreductase [Kiloniellales bacterium]